MSQREKEEGSPSSSLLTKRSSYCKTWQEAKETPQDDDDRQWLDDGQERV